MPGKEAGPPPFDPQPSPGPRSGENADGTVLPPALAAALAGQEYACVHEQGDQGPVFVLKAPAHEIESVRGRIPVQVRHELYEHEAAPVARTVFRLYDQPEAPLAFETFYNVADPHQRATLTALAEQDELKLLFFDEQLTHRLSKAVRHDERLRETIPALVAVALKLRDAIPEERFDFDRAKAEVLAQTAL